MVNKPIPTDPRRVLLVNPTKYLGNLLVAGGLLQAWVQHCSQHGIDTRIVLDDSFRGLCEHSFPEGTLLFFPRRQINSSAFLRKISLYIGFLKEVRQFRADIAFNIEEDSATSHLTRLSGALFKIGCNPHRHKSGYDFIVPIQFEQRPDGRRHRWYSYYDVFAALGMTEPQPSYLALDLDDVSVTLQATLKRSGVTEDSAVIAIHAGATKDYKKWPPEHFAALVTLIQENGMQPVLIGAGPSDMETNDAIRQILATQACPSPADLCSQLTLVELAQFLKTCSAMIGNDSGPFHLGSALGTPGFVMWGPTNKDIWGPLGKKSEIVQGSFPCDPACNKGYCVHDHRCLRELSPASVFARLAAKMT